MAYSTSTIGTKLPKNDVIGTGEDVFVLRLAQDFYKEDAKITISVDGQQVGGVVSISSLYRAGMSDTLTLYGNWGPGAHKLTVNFVNAAYDPLTGGDSNVAILGASYNGVEFLNKTNMLWSGGGYSFMTDRVYGLNGTAGRDVFGGTKAAEIITAGTGDDAMWGGGGRDIFVEKRGDGRETITDFAVSGTNADVIRLSNYMIASFDELKPRMAQNGRDTLLFLDANNSILLKNVDMTTLTAANFEILNSVAKPTGVNLSAGTGSDTLVLKITQDYFTGGNAQYKVTVDGKQVGGIFTASAVRMTGEQDTLTLRGNWGPGNHQVAVTFLNDAFNTLTLEDRNLKIESASLNGENVSGVAKLMGQNGTFSFVAAAVIATAPASDVILEPVRELFSFASGIGGKVISGFETKGADADVLSLTGYGSLNLATQAKQVGTDTVIQLSATDSVTLKDVKASELTADNFSLQKTFDGAMNWATNNGWIVFNNTWGSGDFTYGEDYTMSATYHTNSMTTGTTFTWDYPESQLDYTKVLGYPSVMFGYDTFDNAKGEYDPAHVLPIQVKDVTALKSSFNYSMSGDLKGFDVAYDIWLTQKPNGIWSDITNEVMIWTHRGDMMTYGNKVGTYTDGKYTATIYHIGTYTALVPDQDYLSGTIDVKDVLDKLRALGIVSDQEYINQIDYGAEPFEGKGSLTLNSLSIDVDSRDAAGIVTSSHADGGVTVQTKTGTAGADTIMAGTAKILSLIGGAGNDTFVFNKGELGAVTVKDFHTDAAAGDENDLLKFVGYGAGATLVHDGGSEWSIHYATGVDQLTLLGVSSLSSGDYTFG